MHKLLRLQMEHLKNISYILDKVSTDATLAGKSLKVFVTDPVP